MIPQEQELREKLQSFKPQFYQQFPQQQFHAGLSLGYNPEKTGAAVHLDLNLDLPQSVINAMVDSIPFGPVVVSDQSQRHVVALSAGASPPATEVDPI